MKKRSFRNGMERYSRINKIESEDGMKGYIITADNHSSNGQIFSSKQEAIHAFQQIIAGDRWEHSEESEDTKKMKALTNKVMRKLNGASINDNIFKLPSKNQFIWTKDKIVSFKKDLESTAKELNYAPNGTLSCPKDSLEKYVSEKRPLYENQALYPLTDELYTYMWSNQDRWNNMSLGVTIMIFEIIENYYNKISIIDELL